MSNKSETYSDSPLGESKQKSQRSYVGMILFIVHLALSISLSVALIISYLTPYISPENFGSLTIMGHFAPILFVSVLVCVLIWLIARQWRMAGAVALVLIPGFFFVTQFYHINFYRNEVKESRESFTLLTYNVRGFYNDDGERVVGDFATYLAESNPFTEEAAAADVICLQEFAVDAEGVETVDSLIRAAIPSVYVRDVHESENVVLRTYSRYPIVADGGIAGSNQGTSQWVDVVKGEGDTLRIFNNHFYTMSISDDDVDNISQGKILSDGDRMLSIIDRVEHNSIVRINHVDSLLCVINETPYRHVVVGDFNDGPMSRVYNLMTSNLHDAFATKGSGYGSTYRPMWGMLRIDYVLYSDGFEPMAYNANKDVELSDHLPVAVQLADTTAPQSESSDSHIWAIIMSVLVFLVIVAYAIISRIRRRDR